MSVRLCLLVCLSACISRKPHTYFIKFFARVMYDCGSILIWRQCNNTLCTSSFVDDVTFAHNGANRQKNYIWVLAYVPRLLPIYLQPFAAYISVTHWRQYADVVRLKTENCIYEKWVTTRCSRRRQTSPPGASILANSTKQRCLTSDWCCHLAK